MCRDVVLAERTTRARPKRSRECRGIGISPIVPIAKAGDGRPPSAMRSPTLNKAKVKTAPSKARSISSTGVRSSTMKAIGAVTASAIALNVPIATKVLPMPRRRIANAMHQERDPPCAVPAECEWQLSIAGATLLSLPTSKGARMNHGL